MQQPIQTNECAHSIVVLVYIGVTTMKKRVYTLYRVSTIGQVEKDDIPMQKEACHEFAERQGWEIVKELSLIHI